MALVYSIQWWATLLFALPLYTTRQVSQRSAEMREMFTQTIGALAEAVGLRWALLAVGALALALGAAATRVIPPVGSPAPSLVTDVRAG